MERSSSPQSSPISAPAELLSYPEAPPGEFIVITVSDTGIGMTNEVLAPLIRAILHHQGEGKGTVSGWPPPTESSNSTEGGSKSRANRAMVRRFGSCCPRGESVAPLEEAIPAPAPERLPGSETVLVVEDDAMVRSILRGMLKNDGYQVFEAACGDDALLVWKDRHRDIRPRRH